MAYSDAIRQASGWTVSTIADLIDGILSVSFPLSWGTWTPTVTGSGSMTVSSLVVGQAKYIQIGKFVWFKIYLTFTIGGTVNNTINISTPVTMSSENCSSFAEIEFAGSPGFLFLGSNAIAAYKASYTNYSTGTSKVVRGQGFYEAA